MAQSASDAAAFRAALAANNMAALWEAEDRGDRARQPEPATLWRWDEVEPLVSEAVRATSIENADRRVLSLRRPASNAMPGPGVTTNLVAALQILMPGETAPAHRHSMGALRFVMEGDGAETVVDGKSCPMEPGDMILTPGWTWHEHVHRGTKRMTWFDGLDVPVHHHLGTVRFEPGPAHDLPPQLPDAAFAAAGLVPQGEAGGRSHSPLYRYPWATAKRALAEAPKAADGSRTLRYTDPTTGGSALELIDCYLTGLEPGQPTAARRSTSAAVCVVAEGSGTSTVGEKRLAWGKNSIFTIPQGNWASHRADQPAVLFLMTDRDLMQRLGLLRDEIRA